MSDILFCVSTGLWLLFLISTALSARSSREERRARQKGMEAHVGRLTLRVEELERLARQDAVDKKDADLWPKLADK